MPVESPSHRAMSDQVMENIRGSTLASKAIFDSRGGHASPDAMLEAMKAASVSPERLRGFARAVQKALEGRA